MLRAMTFVAAILAALLARAQAVSEDAYDKIQSEVEKYGKENRRLNVPKDHGRFLQQMIIATQAKRVLEIGTSNGYSGLWLAKGLLKTGGKLDTVEINKAWADEAAANFKKAGVFESVVTLHVGDAFKVVPALEGQYDLIFMDVWKTDYVKFFDLVLPKLRPGGVLLGHNAVRQAKDMADFLDKIKTHPDLLANVVQIGDDGFAFCVRKK